MKMTLAPHLPIKYGSPNNEDGKEAPPPPVVPDDAKDVGHYFQSFDKRLWMFYRHWEPPLHNNDDNNDNNDDNGSRIKATLMILHGSVDHSGVYEELARALNGVGVAVIALDMRGWGLSDGESMYFHDTDTFVQDLHALYTRVHDHPRYQCVRQRFLLGKSLGGLVTAYAVEKYPTNWTGLLGLSGAYTIDPKMMMSPLVMAMLTMVARFLPKLPVKPLFDEHLIVADQDALEQWRNDTLCCKDRLRIGYGVEITRAIDGLPASLSYTTKLPMLMMIGSDDEVVTRQGHQLMVDLNQSGDKELKIYPAGRHNLLQEPTLKDAVIQDIVEWIGSRSL